MTKFRNRSAAHLKNSRIGGGAILFAIFILGLLASQKNSDNPGIENFDIPQKINKEVIFEAEAPKLTEANLSTDLKSTTSTKKEEDIEEIYSTSSAASVQKTSSAVKYGSLQANIVGNDGKIFWSTLFQRHIKNFEVQRSLDDESYETIGQIEGAGKGSHEKEELYEFMDKTIANVQMPRVYYRIKQTGFDGLEEYSPAIEYEFGLDLGLYSRIDKNKEGEVKILYAADKSGPINMRILDVAGQVMNHQELEADFDPQTLLVDASDWKEGKYFLQLRDGSTSVMEQFSYAK